jgi:hypothetical protein
VGPTCQMILRQGGTHMGEVDQREAVTWHNCAEVAQSGAATWQPSSLSSDFCFMCYSSLICTQVCLYPQVVPKEACDLISAFD